MAGGKETPRQKMIGMMYLVLTALLALNVSKSILDAFVSLEENIQKANLTELYRGDERKSAIQETSLDKSEPLRASRAQFLLGIADQIDEMTTERIQLIDQLKLKILEDCGENLEVGEETILQSKASESLKPIRMNLQLVEAKDKYDEAMHLLIGDDITNPNEEGMKLWNSVIDYRSGLTELLAKSHAKNVNGKLVVDESYGFKAPVINSQEDQKSLDVELKKAMDAGKIHPDDKRLIAEIYKSLTKEEFSEVNEVENVHWIGKTFDHSPSVAAIAALSGLQNDILKARADAMDLLRSRIGGDSYSFNTIMPLAYGPEIVNQGDNFDLNVMMVAFDSDRQPEVTMNGNKIDSIVDGKAVVNMTATSGLMEMKGTITVRNKAGIAKTMDWTKSVMVMKPAGSIEMPEFNVLYRNYKNKVNATASGFPETVLTATGATIRKVGDGYEVTPDGSGRTAQLIVSGRTDDGRTTRLKTINYRVSPLPDPTLYWGAVKNGGKVPPSNFMIFPKYGNEIPLNLNFTVVSWTVSVDGSREVTGRGNNISAARPLINAARANSNVRIDCWIQPESGPRQKLSGVFTK